MPADRHPATSGVGTIGSTAGATALDNHQRFGRVTLSVVLLLAGALTVLLTATGHGRAGTGLLAGALVACVDGWLLSRSLTRFSRNLENVRAGTLTVAMMTRFLTVAGSAAVLIAAGGLDAVGVLAGLLLLPVCIVGVALWTQSGRTLRRTRDAAAR